MIKRLGLERFDLEQDFDMKYNPRFPRNFITQVLSISNPSKLEHVLTISILTILPKGIV